MHGGRPSTSEGEETDQFVDAEDRPKGPSIAMLRRQRLRRAAIIGTLLTVMLAAAAALTLYFTT